MHVHHPLTSTSTSTSNNSKNDKNETAVSTDTMHMLLSPASYDDDASVHSPTPSDQETDSEDDEFLRNSRTTLELAQYDRTVLDEEDEREKLLIRGNSPADGLRRIFSPSASQPGSVRIGKKERRRQRQQQREEERRRRRRKERDEHGRLLYEMEDEEEEAEGDDDSLLRRSEESVGFDEKAYYQSYKTGGSRLRYALVFAAVFVLFMILLLGAYKASAPFRASRRVRPLLSNGTALFAPTTILISLDGFRADFLHRGITPALSTFMDQGVSPEYMLPSFPSVTFPNHFTLVTGLYPESHGVVGNSFYDPDLEEEFFYTDSANSMRAKWWTAEPIWNTLEKQGLKSAIHMWPGSEAHIGGVDPSYIDEFNRSEDLSRKTDRILGLLDLPGEEENGTGDAERPQLIAAYVPDVDSNGHKFGPNSTVVQGTIARVDNMLAGLVKGLDARNLTDVVNVVIVSDHGMATTDVERVVQLEDLIDLDLVDHIDGWPSRGLRPKNPESHKILEQQLHDAAPNYSHAVEIYSLETMPERYHFTKNHRIAPLWVIPKTGWAIVERPDFDAKKALAAGDDYSPKGIHGYDHEHPLMRAIFLAKGPAFVAPPNSRLEPFQNVNVYNILCDSLGIEPQPNNGTLRLPLRPVGLHSDPNEDDDDLPKESPNATIPNQPDQPGHPDSEDDKGPTWWATLWGKVNEFKHWAGSVAEAVKDNVVHH